MDLLSDMATESYIIPLFTDIFCGSTTWAMQAIHLRNRNGTSTAEPVWISDSKFQVPNPTYIESWGGTVSLPLLRFASFSSSWKCLDAIFLSGAWWHRQQQALLDPAGRGQKYTYCEVTPLVSNLLILLLHLLLFLLLGPGKLSLPMFVGDLSKKLWRIRHCLMQGRWIFWCFRRRPPPAYGGRESNIIVFDCVLTHVYIYIYKQTNILYIYIHIIFIYIHRLIHMWHMWRSYSQIYRTHVHFSWAHLQNGPSHTPTLNAWTQRVKV